jgi:hypothetical protein
VTHGFTIQFSGNLEACRTEARISAAPAHSAAALLATVYETTQGFVVEYFGSGLANPALPGLDAAIAEARAELLHYINRRGENRPKGITRPGLSLWLTERDDETVIGIPLE